MRITGERLKGMAARISASSAALDTTMEAVATAMPPAAPATVTVTGTVAGASRIGKYVVLRQLGEGGMGVVVAAYDEELDRRVAIKLLRDKNPATPERRTRILREAQAMARVSHPNVVHVYEVGEVSEPGAAHSQVFIAMEFIDGMTLASWQQQPERTWEEILVLYTAAGQGLLAAHQSGLVHRDFKPENVLVGSDGRPRVADFGLARSGEGGVSGSHAPLGQEDLLEHGSSPSSPGQLLRSPLTQDGTIMGTPLYMSPEQHQGIRTDSRSDQFSFCAALYEALYKTQPFAGETLGELRVSVMAGRVKPPPSGSAIPRPIHSAILRGLSTDPAQRFESMKELLAAISFNSSADPAAVPLSRRIFSLSLSIVSIALVSMFLGPAMRNQNTVEMALISSSILFVGMLTISFLLRKTLLKNSFHRGVVVLILMLCSQEVLISIVAPFSNMNVHQIILNEMIALAVLAMPLGYFFFPAAWFGIPVVLFGLVWSVLRPQDSGVTTMLVHLWCALTFILMWNRSAESWKNDRRLPVK